MATERHCRFFCQVKYSLTDTCNLVFDLLIYFFELSDVEAKLSQIPPQKDYLVGDLPALFLMRSVTLTWFQPKHSLIVPGPQDWSRQSRLQ